MNLSQFKKTIQNLDQSDLQDLLAVLFQKSSNGKLLIKAYFGQLDEVQVFDTALSKIENCFRKNGVPATHNPKLKEAKIYSQYFS
ncbi:MAG: hypothetical protein WCK98_03560 [bacterium]